LSELGTSFGQLFSAKNRQSVPVRISGAEEVNLAPFLKFALIELVRYALSNKEN
jgi:hypothetical protein